MPETSAYSSARPTATPVMTSVPATTPAEGGCFSSATTRAIDEYTTLIPTNDRIMATSLVARWRYIGTDIDWASSYASIKQIMLEQFAQVQSLALQQTLYEMGKAVLEAHDGVAEIKFSAPNKHHFVYNLEPFGLENPNEVFHADDRPYGLIEATVLRDDAPPAGRAWDTVPGFA